MQDYCGSVFAALLATSCLASYVAKVPIVQAAGVPQKAFDFCLRTHGGSYDLPSRSVVERTIRSTFRSENPYATTGEADSYVTEKLPDVLSGYLTQRDSVVQSNLVKAKENFVAARARLDVLDLLIRYPNTATCRIHQRPYASNGDVVKIGSSDVAYISYSAECAQEFTVTTNDYQSSESPGWSREKTERFTLVRNIFSFDWQSPNRTRSGPFWWLIHSEEKRCWAIGDFSVYRQYALEEVP